MVFNLKFRLILCITFNKKNYFFKGEYHIRFLWKIRGENTREIDLTECNQYNLENYCIRIPLNLLFSDGHPPTRLRVNDTELTLDLFNFKALMFNILKDERFLQPE